MRVTRDTLLKIAQETVDNRVRRERAIMAAYLCGSLLEEEYLLGGTADVDLIFVHADVVPVEREIHRLSDEVHLDIAHHPQADYRRRRRLRVHPWLGHVINSCKVLYDPQHFMDFTQASVRGQFDRPDHVMTRARCQVEQARSIWLSFQTVASQPSLQSAGSYLRAVSHVANAIASLSGPPLTERRLLLRFPSRAEAVARSGLYPGLLGLLGAPNLRPGSLSDWLPSWGSAYGALPEGEAPARLHFDRRAYYQQAFETMLGSPQPEAVLWPLLRTWTLAMGLLPTDSRLYEEWSGALQQLGLLGEAFTERVAALDAYIDLVDETLEDWGREHGA